MLHEYHVIYSVRYYPRFHVTAVCIGTYYQWIRGVDSSITATELPLRVLLGLKLAGPLYAAI
jgi:hypothetical protein